ncbi:MAG: porin family protein [Chitinophagaceae bacterium]
MKRIILLGTGFMMSIATFAQFSFGVQGTGNLTDAKIKKEDAFAFKKKMKAMPGAGVVVQYQINENLAIRSGGNYQQNGITLKATLNDENNMKVELKNSLNYVQVPVHVLYVKPAFGTRFYAGVGGYVNYGVSGKVKGKFSYSTPEQGHVDFTEEVKAFKKEEDGGAGFKRADFGISAIAGVELLNGLFCKCRLPVWTV